MIAVDTNILVYAHREDSAFHSEADRQLTELTESGSPWAIPWPCLHEFLAIVTHPKIYSPPTPLKEALIQVDYWLECPMLHMMSELEGYWGHLKEQLITTKMTGPQIHDVRIAAICLQNNIKTLWSADRDFNRVKGLTVLNPLVS